MKKVTKIVTVAASAMCAFAVLAGSFVFAAAQNRAYAAAARTYTIEYTADSNVQVKGPASARAGSKVEVSLTYNFHKFEVTGVRVGDEYAAKVDDKNYYFVMPDGAANVVVESRALAEDEDVFTITNLYGNSGVYLDGCPASARAGDPVIFCVSMAADSPFNFADYIEVFYEEAGSNVYVDTFNFGDGWFGFEMPEAEVSIFTLLEAKYYFLTFDDDQFVYTVAYKDNVSMGAGDDFVYAEYNEDEGYFIPFGADVEVTFIDSYVKRVTGVKVNSQQLDFKNDTIVSFEMPGKDVELQIVTADFYRPVVADNDPNDHFYAAGVNYNYAFYRGATATGDFEEFDPATAMYGDYVRTYITPKDDLRKATGYNVIYTNAAGSYYTVSFTKGTDANGTYVQFQVGTGIEYCVCVSGEQLKAFANHQLPGYYKGNNIWQNGSSSKSGTYIFDFKDEWGSCSIRSTNYNALPDGENTPATGDGTVLLNIDGYTNTGRGFYGNGFIVTSYNAYTGADKTTDLNVYYKVANSSDSVSLRYRYQSTGFCAVEAYVNNEYAASCFYTLNGGVKLFYANGVEFEMTSGTAINTAGTAFNVKVNGTVIGTVDGTTYTAA